MTRRVVNYSSEVSRWAPDAEVRLHAAAMELFLEQGFAATTVPQITERAGLTTRSFFRYFADKREILFAGEDELPGVVARIFSEADPDLAPMDVVRLGCHSVLGPRLRRLRPDLLARRRVLESDEGLKERQLRKLAILHQAATGAFRDRGLGALEADLAGRIAVAVIDSALEQWLTDDTRSFETITDDLLDALPRLVTSASDKK